MALTKKVSYSHEITEFGHIQVRRITRIMENGEEISKSYHRNVVSPGESTEGKDARTVAIASVIHTPEVIAAYTKNLEQAL